MKMTQKTVMGCFFLVICFSLLIALPVAAENADALSREINNELRNAQSLVFKGKAQEAQGLLENIQSKMEQLKAADPNHRSLKGLEGKYDKLQKDLGRRLAKEEAPKATKPTAQKASSDTFPAGAARCIREMDRAMKQAERSLNLTTGTPESRVKQARYEMKQADMYWEDLQKKYPESIQHPDAAAAKERLDASYAKIASHEKGAAAEKEKAAQTDAEKGADSTVWLERLRPYVASRNEEGYVPEKEFISGYTENAEDMNHRMELFAEASNLFAEYQKTSFSQGKSDRLEQVEKKLAYKLETFKKELDMAAEGYFEKVASELKRGEAFLAKNEERCKDGKTKPYLLNASVLNNLAKDIEWAESLKPGDSRLPGTQKQFADLNKEQSRWRERMIESTVMLPDKFNGKESSALKDKAKGVVTGSFSDAKILRVTVISPDWKEERVLEFTDTTRSAVRYRITRSVTAQAAAKRGSDCYLYSVYIGKDRRSDGSWDAYKGHIMFTDRMLEKNVTK
jgi:hypothetical protein